MERRGTRIALTVLLRFIQLCAGFVKTRPASQDIGRRTTRFRARAAAELMLARVMQPPLLGA